MQLFVFSLPQQSRFQGSFYHYSSHFRQYPIIGTEIPKNGDQVDPTAETLRTMRFAFFLSFLKFLRKLSAFYQANSKDFPATQTVQVTPPIRKEVLRITAMASQYLHSFDQNSLALTHLIPAKPRMLQQKIAGIVTLLSSLNAAVEDLETTQVPAMNEDFDFYQEVEKFEVKLIKSALRLSNGSQAKAAKLLKLNPTTLSAKMKILKLTRGTR